MSNKLPFPFKVKQGLKTITPATLKIICPQAFETFNNAGCCNLGSELTTGDLSHLWAMASKPVPKEKPDEDGFFENWTETNEPELAEWLSEEWDDHAVTYKGHKFVILCRSWDDEYGLFWSNKDQVWVNYSF